jgi:hypothetical protein
MPGFNVPLINGVAYDWASVRCVIMGTMLSGITAIKYDDEQKMQNNFGAGKYPVSRGSGNVECSSSLTIHAEELEALAASAPGNRIQDFPPFDIIVSYQPASGNIVTHTIKNAQFTANKRELKQGDMVIESEIPLIISHIIW